MCKTKAYNIYCLGDEKKTPVYGTEREYADSSTDRVQCGKQCRTAAFICNNRKWCK